MTNVPDGIVEVLAMKGWYYKRTDTQTIRQGQGHMHSARSAFRRQRATIDVADRAVGIAKVLTRAEI